VEVVIGTAIPTSYVSAHVEAQQILVAFSALLVLR
jgi:hypothetical protein